MKQLFTNGTTVWVINLGEYGGLSDKQQLTIKNAVDTKDGYLYSFEESETKLLSRYITATRPINHDNEETD